MILCGINFDCYADVVIDYLRVDEDAHGMIFPLMVDRIPAISDVLHMLDYDMLYLHFEQIKHSGPGRWHRPALYLKLKNGCTLLLSCATDLLSDEEYDTFGFVEADPWQAKPEKTKCAMVGGASA